MKNVLQTFSNNTLSSEQMKMVKGGGSGYCSTCNCGRGRSLNQLASFSPSMQAGKNAVMTGLCGGTYYCDNWWTNTGNC